MVISETDNFSFYIIYIVQKITFSTPILYNEKLVSRM